MKQASSSELTKQLFEKIQTIRVRDPAAIFGTTSAEGVLQQLITAVAALAHALHDNAGQDVALQAYDKAVMAVDTAALTGVIAEGEVVAYYELTDKIWAAIEREQQ